MAEAKQADLDVPLEANSPSSNNKPDANISLEYCYKYASILVRLQIPRNIASPEELPEAINDLTQTSVIRFWNRLTSSKRGEIASPKAYLRRIVYSQCIDIARGHKRKPSLPLPLDQDGEPQQGKVLLNLSEGMQDPAIEFERKEFIAELIQDVLRLPPKQRYAMICVLKDEVAHIFPLEEMFLKHGMDIRNIHWPDDPAGLQKLRSLLVVARKTLRSLKKYDDLF